MRTILITIFQAVEAKNILRTNVITSLLDKPDVRVICLTRFKERAEYYQKVIPHERIVYDAFYQAPPGPVERFFSFLKFHLLKTATTDLRRSMHRHDAGNYPLYLAGSVFNYLIARRTVRQFLRFFDYHLVGDGGFGAVLETYRPDVVFLAHLFDDAEIALLRGAQKRKIPTVGFINTWDKLTARSALRLLPDTLVVFNDIVKEEALRYADMPADKIAVCGIPQYDQYVSAHPLSREAFFKKINLDPKKLLILYAPMGATFSNSDWDMIDLLHSLIDKTELGTRAQLFVRFQPNDYASDEELKKRPWLKYDRPGIRYGSERGGDWDLDFKDLAHLTDTLTHMSVLISYASSIGVDTAIFHHPVININFEIKNDSPMAKSPTQFYKTEHYQKALQSGGIRLVSSKDELVQWLKTYLAEPEIDAAGRERLAAEQCFTIDGKSGERIASVIFAHCGAYRRSPF